MTPPYFPLMTKYLHSTIIFLLCLTLLLPMKAFAFFNFSVTNHQIENALFLYFPLSNYSTAAKLSLNEPTVILKKTAHALQLNIPVTARIPGIGRKKGLLIIDINLHYKAVSGELFLGTPHIRSFEMSDISAEHYNTFRASLADMLAKTLPLVRIFQVRESDLNHTLEKSMMKTVTIDDGALEIVIGFN